MKHLIFITAMLVCAGVKGQVIWRYPPADSVPTLPDRIIYGTIQLMPDSSKISQAWLVPGYAVTNLFKETRFYDLQDRQLFKQRFKKAIFLTFYMK